jgi:putative PEP-CTERM system TPR-repeat lipoprotein
MQNISIYALTSWISSNLTKSITMISFVFLLAACQQKTAEEYLQEADAFSASGDHQAAVVALKNAVQLDSRASKSRFKLGKVYLELKNYESAEKELTRAKELGYPENEVIPLLAQALQRTGANVELSVLKYNASDLTNSEQMEVGFRKIQSLVQLEKLSEANILIRDLLKLETGTVYKGLVEGYMLVLNEKIPEALAIVEAMHERAPLNRDVLNFTARLHMVNGDPAKAADLYEEYIRVAQDDIEAKFSLASMLVEQKDSKRAEKYIDELLLIAENNPYLNQLKGVVRAADSDFKAAKLYSEKAINLGRPDPALRLIAGFSSYQLEEYQTAIGHLSIIASSLPDNHPGLRILAASQLQVNMGDEAGEVLTRVSEATTQDASLFSRAGYELIKSGNTQAAKEIIEQAGKISESSEDLTRLGVLKLSINDIEGLVDLESAVEKSPSSVTAKTTLASAYLGTNQLDKAMELAKQWQKDEPASIDGVLLEAEVLQRQELYAEASVVVSKALRLDSTSIPAKLAAIRLNLREKKFDEALKKTEALLNLEPNNLPALASYFALKNEAKDAQPAIDRIRQAASNNPNDANLALLLARITLSTNNPKEAIAAMKNIVSNRQAPPSFWQIKGLALLRAKERSAALEHYNKWAELFPNQENAVMGQLLILDSTREYKKGAQAASDFLSRKENLQLKIMQSYFMVMSGDVTGSKAVVASIDDKFQPLPFLRGVKARIALMEGKGETVIEDASAAYISNKSSDNLFVYVRTLDAANMRDKSLEIISQHVVEFPNDGRGKLLLAERQMGADSANALATYEAMLVDYPNNFVVLNNAAFLLMEANNLEKAHEYALRAYKIQPENVATADTYAQILLRQGKIAQAVDVYERVMNDEVKSEEISLNYIEALLKNERLPIAKRLIEKLNLTTAESKARLAKMQEQYLN